MAVVYVCIDHYLKNSGVASFVLPQTFVKSLKGGEGFRKFCITRDGHNEPFSIEAVFDMLQINPFKGIATNKTSVYVLKKSIPMTYPMDNYLSVSCLIPYRILMAIIMYYRIFIWSKNLQNLLMMILEVHGLL